MSIPWQVKFTLIAVIAGSFVTIGLNLLGLTQDGPIPGKPITCAEKKGAATLGVSQACDFSTAERDQALKAAAEAASFLRETNWTSANFDGRFRPVGQRQVFAGEACQRIEHTITEKSSGQQRVALGSICEKLAPRAQPGESQ
jgi:hypothetical protein